MTKEDLLGYQYALKVVSGEIIANKWIKLECSRYISRLNGEEEDITFNYKKAKKIYKLLSIINYATGFHANKPIIEHIAGFQIMAIENIFCLYYKDRDALGNRVRVIEEVYLEIGRKAGKSFLAGLIELLFMLLGEKYSQFACAGKTRDISGLVRQSVVELINSSPAIKKYFKITRDKITCTINECYMTHLSGEADNINGELIA